MGRLNLAIIGGNNCTYAVDNLERDTPNTLTVGIFRGAESLILRDASELLIRLTLILGVLE